MSEAVMQVTIKSLVCEVPFTCTVGGALGINFYRELGIDPEQYELIAEKPGVCESVIPSFIPSGLILSKGERIYKQKRATVPLEPIEKNGLKLLKFERKKEIPVEVIEEEISVQAVLREALGDCDDVQTVLILQVTKDGDYYWHGNTGCTANSLLVMERSKKYMIERDEDEEDGQNDDGDRVS
jgi:hypothetical protein